METNIIQVIVYKVVDGCAKVVRRTGPYYINGFLNDYLHEYAGALKEDEKHFTIFQEKEAFFDDTYLETFKKLFPDANHDNICCPHLPYKLVITKLIGNDAKDSEISIKIAQSIPNEESPITLKSWQALTWK